MFFTRAGETGDALIRRDWKRDFLLENKILILTFSAAAQALRISCSTLVSTMHRELVDMENHQRIAALGQRIINGGAVERAEGEWLFQLESPADIFDLMSWANRIREHFK